MHVTCRFFRDALNAVAAALTWGFIEDDSREYLRNFRRLFMYSVSLEYMNNYAGGMEWEQEKREGKREKALGGLDDLIDKVDLSAWHDLSATRGRAFTFSSLVFPFASLSHDPRNRGEIIRTCVPPFVSSTYDIIRDETPMSYAPRVFFSFTCFSVSFVSSPALNEYFFFPMQNINSTSNLSKPDVLLMKNRNVIYQ